MPADSENGLNKQWSICLQKADKANHQHYAYFYIIIHCWSVSVCGLTPDQPRSRAVGSSWRRHRGDTEGTGGVLALLHRETSVTPAVTPEGRAIPSGAMGLAVPRSPRCHQCWGARAPCGVTTVSRCMGSLQCHQCQGAQVPHGVTSAKVHGLPVMSPVLGCTGALRCHHCQGA